MAKETDRNVPPGSPSAAPGVAGCNPAAPSSVFASLLPAGAAAAEIRSPGEGALREPADYTLEALLYPRERASIAAAVPRRRHEFAAGRLCARRALAERGITAFELLPGADRAPLWPASIAGSITHTDGYCAAAVADRGRIASLGIDTEVLGAVREELWPRLLTEKELSRIAALAPPSRAAAATLLFAAKEALYKCRLTGQRLGFHDVCIDWEEPTGGPDRGRPAADCVEPTLPARGVLRIEPRRPLQSFERTRRQITARYCLHERYVSTAVWMRGAWGMSTGLSRPCRP